jgi:hypothetical protein
MEEFAAKIESAKHGIIEARRTKVETGPIRPAATRAKHAQVARAFIRP